MNFQIIRKILGRILIAIAVLMLFPLVVSLIYREGLKNFLSFLIPIISVFIIGALLLIGKVDNKKITPREGIVIVGMSWIIVSLIGSLPFMISGEIPNFFTAFFEITSGFTTTGASALEAYQIEALSHSMLFFRSFSHWIGGMGILVFILAIVPESKEGSSVHILRAESPGPSVGKLVSKMRLTSQILYLIYVALSALEMIILLLLKDKNMGFFESLVYTFSTAGTGGFATTGQSIAYYSKACQYVIGTFMIIFGINFTMFYYMLIRNFKDVYKNEELRLYFSIIIFSVVVIMINTYNIYDSFEETFRYSFFTVSSIISTTGFSNVDYCKDNWPALSLLIIIVLSIFGSCAGSTSGGVKLSRILILSKYSKSKIKNQIRPRNVELMNIDGKVVSNNIVESTIAYFIIYVIVLLMSAILISVYNPKIENLDPLSSITASIACISNVGPGLGIVGPSGSYANFSAFSKVILSFEMIAGRLELFPILVLFNVKTWRKRI